MENVILAVGMVFPMALMMALGYGLYRWKLWNTATLNQMNGVVFRVLFPIYLFNNIYQADLKTAFNQPLLLFALTATVLLVGVLYLSVPLFVKDPRRCSVVIQAIFRSNFLLFGMAIAQSLYGDVSGGTAAVLVAFVVPTYNVFAVIILERFRGGKSDVKKIIRGIVTNPLILGSLLGLAMSASGILLPAIVERSLTDITRISTPMALMILGGSFQFSAVGKNLRVLTWTTLVRLVVVPAVFLFAAVQMGFTGSELAVLLGMFAAPNAVSSFTMAKQMDADAELAGQIIVVQSICSIVSLFGWIFLLKQLGCL